MTVPYPPAGPALDELGTLSQATPGVSLRANYFYNTLQTATGILFPIIAFSYVSRVFGPETLGRVNLALSLCTFLSLVAALGIPVYGAREVAKARDDTARCRHLFSELFSLAVAASVLVSAAYLCLVLFVPRFSAHPALYLSAGLSLFLGFLSVDWFYQGFENYRYICLRSVAFRALGLLAVLVAIHDPSDSWRYVLLGTVTASGSSLLGFAHVPRLLRPTVTAANLTRHLRPSLLIFGSAVAASTYVYLDTAIVALLAGDTSAGLYSAAAKVARVAIAVLTSLAAVLLPRLSYYVQHRHWARYTSVAQRSLHFICMLSFPFAVGVAVLAPQIVEFLAGPQFSSAVLPLRILCIMIPVVGYNGFLGQQVFLANGEERRLFQVTLVAAVVALVLDVALVPALAHTGAALATLSAESACFVGYLVFGRKRCLAFRFLDRPIATYVVASLLMGGVVLPVASLLASPVLSAVAGMAAGVAAYAATLLVAGDPLAREIALTLWGAVRRLR